MDTSAAPRCYILDEGYRLVLACKPSPVDPLNRLYGAEASADVLPVNVECVVRTLTGAWARLEAPQEASDVIDGVKVTVAPLQGAAGRHIAVFVEPEYADPPAWDYAKSA
jgi:hypothetical protein